MKKHKRHRWSYYNATYAFCTRCGVPGTCIPHPTSVLEPGRVKPEGGAKCLLK